MGTGGEGVGAGIGGVRSIGIPVDIFGSITFGHSLLPVALHSPLFPLMPVLRNEGLLETVC